MLAACLGGDTTVEAQIHRADEHREIKLRTLESIPMGDAERGKWERLIEELRERKVLDVAAKAGDAALAKGAYRRVRNLGSPDLRGRLRLRAKLIQAVLTRPAAQAPETPRRPARDDLASNTSGQPTMKVSALVTTYNGARFIEAQLESIAKQTLPVAQVVIADDGSTDGTLAIVEDFISTNELTGWSLVRNETNLGPSANVLTHLKGLDGDLVLLADQDDVWERNKAEVLASYLSGNPALDLVVSHTRIVDADGHFSEPGARGHLPARVLAARARRTGGVVPLTFDDFVGYSGIPLHAMGVRGTLARLIADLQEFPPLSKSLGADWFIGMVSTIRGNAALVPEALVRRRIHDANISLGRLRKTTALTGSNRQRIPRLQEARDAHLFLLQYPPIRESLTDQHLARLAEMVAHIGRRISFTKDPAVSKAVGLLLRMNQYVRSAGAVLPGVRMWVADIMYAYGINWRLLRKRPDVRNG